MQLLDIIDKLCDYISKGKHSQDVNDLIFSHKVLAGRCFDLISSNPDNIRLQFIDLQSMELNSFSSSYVNVLETLYSNIMILFKLKECKDSSKSVMEDVVKCWEQSNELILRLWNIAAEHHKSSDDNEDSSSHIQPFEIILFIAENAAVTVVYQCLMCINKWWNEADTTFYKKSERLFIDTTASLLTLRGAIFTVTVETKDILVPNVHEQTFILQSRGESIHVSSNSNNKYENAHLFPVELRKPYYHNSYFHALIHTHHSVVYQLNAFYQEIQDELGVFGCGEFTRQQSLTTKKAAQGQPTNWKGFVELSMTNVYIFLMKFWDTNNALMKSATTGSLNPMTFYDIFISHCILNSFSSITWQWKDPRSGILESSLLVQSSGLVSIIAIATKLSDSYEESTITLGLHLFYQLFLCTSPSTLLPVIEWIAPKLFQIHTVTSSELSRIYAHRVLHVILTISTQSALLVQYQQKYIASTANDLSREYEPRKAWVLLLSMEPCLDWYPKIIICTHFTDVIQCLLHGCNIWQLPVQSITLRILELFLKRFPAEMRLYVVPFITELIRMLLFYRSKLVPDISMASNEEILELQLQIANCIKLIRTVHKDVFERWRENLISSSSMFRVDNAINADEKNHDNTQTIEYVFTILSCLEDIVQQQDQEE